MGTCIKRYDKIYDKGLGTTKDHSDLEALDWWNMLILLHIIHIKNCNKNNKG
jgi:hypothetical protein